MLSLPEKYGHTCTSQTRTFSFVVHTKYDKVTIVRSSEITYALANKGERDILNVTGLELNQVRNQAIEPCCTITYSSLTAIINLPVQVIELTFSYLAIPIT